MSPRAPAGGGTGAPGTPAGGQPTAPAGARTGAPGTFVLHREQYLPEPPAAVFPFFADAHNLEAITPGWLRFRILTPGPIAMRPGARIEYRLRLAGLPVRWRTRIATWRPGELFVDEQERGPYALWRHEHRFEAVGGGTLMTDRVTYRLPLGVLGRAVHALAVRAALSAIFDHRFRRLRQVWGLPAEGGVAADGPPPAA